MIKMGNRGFTLIEILATIAIIAVLGLIAVPSVLSAIQRSKSTSYQVMVENIKTAGQEMYEELEFTGGPLYYQDSSGERIEIKIQNGEIRLNLQSLVSNGFLKGSNQEKNAGDNSQTKVLLNPENNVDIGHCVIKVKKIVNKEENYKTTYQITNESLSDDNCPNY